MANVILQLIFFIISVIFCLVSAETYKCKERDPNICYLTDIQLAKDDPDFEIEVSDRSNIYTVYVEESKIPTLSSSLCKPFPNLINLYIFSAAIETISEDAFKDCPSLEFFDLRNNYLKNVPETLFQNSTNLEFLFLDGNLLEELPENLFSSSTKLKAVSINNNRIKDIPFSALTNNQNLEFLYLHSNDLIAYDIEQVLAQFPNLIGVSFNNNLLSCERYFEIVDLLNEREIRVISSTLPRQRFVQVQEVGQVYCLADVDWTGVYYKRIAESQQEQEEELLDKIKDTKIILSKKVNLIKKLLKNIVENKKV